MANSADPDQLASSEVYIPIQQDKGELTNIIISAIHLKILTEIC